MINENFMRKYFPQMVQCILVVLVLLWCGVREGNAQVPSCNKFSAGISEEGYSEFQVSELLRNEPTLPLYLIIRSINHNRIFEKEITDLQETIKTELCGYVNSVLIYEIQNKDGFCSDTLHVSIPPPPTMTGRRISVLCDDPLVASGQLIGDTFPSFNYPCGPVPQLSVNEDFVQARDCQNSAEPIQQIIYREIEGYDHWDQRFSAVDTIVVYKIPEITPHHIEMDTVYHLYCGENKNFGPKVIFENPVTRILDTISLLSIQPQGQRQVGFLPAQIAGLCNVTTTVQSAISINTKCEKQYQVNLEFDQKCFFKDGTKPLEVVPARGLTKMEDGRFRMTFKVVDVDTMAPTINTNELVITTYSSSQNCEAPFVVPGIMVDELCSGIRRVQASSPGYFTVRLKKNNAGDWIPEEKIMLPKDGQNYTHGDSLIENAFKVIVEASDSCDLVSQDSFYIKVEDNTAPTVSLLKNIRVGLVGQLTWLDVDIMNEGSRDNCGVAMVLGRRTDWATAGGVNLCDGLETDPRINPIEAYYASFLKRLSDFDIPCGDWLSEEWRLDSILQCGGVLPEDLVRQIGGGWTDQIPFTCDDACEDIEVELLVIDNWCNFSSTRTTVKVRDKQPIHIVQDVQPTIDINCSSYNQYYAEIINRAVALNNRVDTDPERMKAFSVLDSVLGGYVPVWQDLDGQMMDMNGNNVIPSEHRVTVRKDKCETYTERKMVEVFDENRGELVQVSQNVPAIRAVPDNEKIENGIVAVNCSSSTYQKIFVDIDACGAGTIRRRFYVAGGCEDLGEEGDWLTRNANRLEFTREQIIYIKPDCGLSPGMIQMPPSVSAMDVCKIEKTPNGLYTGELHPDFTGWPEYTWSMECRDLTMGYEDKLFRLFGNNPLGQWRLVRNWHISDRCSENNSVIHFEQVMILNELEVCDSLDITPLISGTIVDPAGAPIRNVSIRALTATEEREVSRTSIQGTYGFHGTRDESYKVFPYKNDEMMRGISTFDLVLIQKHILGIQPFDNIYQRIAADVNNNGVIDPTDMIELRKSLLRPDFVFSNNTSYQFRAAGSNANFAEVPKLNDDTMVDFVGIKVGDVNFSASNAVPTSRRSGLKMNVHNQWLYTGDMYRIPVRSGSDIDILGFQFELKFKPGTVHAVGLESGSLKFTKDHYAVLDDGILTASWFDVDERRLSKDEILFYIVLGVDRQTTLDHIMEPSSQVLHTESYVEPGIVQQLWFSIDGLAPKKISIRNYPNPFKDYTVVRFQHEAAGSGDIHVHDATGRLVLQRSLTLHQGENEVVIQGSDLPGPGLYYYRLLTKEHQWTHKMIYIQ